MSTRDSLNNVLRVQVAFVCLARLTPSIHSLSILHCANDPQNLDVCSDLQHQQRPSLFIFLSLEDGVALAHAALTFHNGVLMSRMALTVHLWLNKLVSTGYLDTDS